MYKTFLYTLVNIFKYFINKNKYDVAIFSETFSQKKKYLNTMKKLDKTKNENFQLGEIKIKNKTLLMKLVENF